MQLKQEEPKDGDCLTTPSPFTHFKDIYSCQLSFHVFI